MSLIADSFTAPPVLDLQLHNAFDFFIPFFPHSTDNEILPFIFVTLTRVQSFLTMTKKAAVQSFILPLPYY